MLEYIQSLSNQPCIVASDLNDLLILGKNRFVVQWMDVVCPGSLGCDKSTPQGGCSL